MEPTHAPWSRDVAPIPARASAPIALATDACVVGAGVAGLTTALYLAREGLRVVVLDAGDVGAGESSRTTAHLASYLDDRFAVLERLHGAEGARLAWASHADAIDRIERLVYDEHIPCDFRRLDGWLVAGDGRAESDLDAEFRAVLRAGVRGAEWVEEGVPLPGLDTGPAVRVPRQGELHPRRYLAGLARAFARQGGEILGGVHVDGVEAIDGGFLVASALGHVKARNVVLATNSPLFAASSLSLKQAAYRTYAVAFALPRSPGDAGVGGREHFLLWDLEDPYHYVRLADVDGEELLVVGGEDHKTGQDDDPVARFRRLEAWARLRFPDLGPVRDRWSGQVLEPNDGLAFLGHVPGGPEGLYVVTGDSGHGFTHATLGAALVADHVAGRENPWARLYDPGRMTLRATGDLLREGMNTALQYTDWFKRGDAPSVVDIPVGGGALVRRGTRLLAVYRDGQGACHASSAVCPHLGGIVHWNPVEAEWQCPCHGSRFDPYGRVLAGPAPHDLARVELDRPAPPPSGAGLRVDSRA